MPGAQLCRSFGNFYADEFCKVQCRQRDDVGHGESFRAYEFARAEFAIQPLHHFERAHAHGLAVVFVLCAKAGREPVRVDPYRTDSCPDRQFDSAYPHVGLRALPGVAAEQRRRGVQFLEIAANRDAFCQRRTVIQFQNRQLAERILGQEFGHFVGAVAHGYMDEGDREVFLGQEDPDAARIGGWIGFVVEFHDACHIIYRLLLVQAGVPAAAGGCYETSVKLAPANQTYIPASNTGRQRFAVSPTDDASAQLGQEALGQALRTAVTGAQLKSVTIVASRPDDNVVVVQAQYAAEPDSASTALAMVPRVAARPAGGNRSSSYLSPIEQYTRTQGGDSRLAPLLDVRA